MTRDHPPRTRVLIVDDHPIVRLGIRQMLAAERDLEVCGEAESVEAAQVLASPVGVLATVTAPREITIRLSNDAPPLISGVVEVQTTSEQHAPLRIPVARYSPDPLAGATREADAHSAKQ